MSVAASRPASDAAVRFPQRDIVGCVSDLILVLLIFFFLIQTFPPPCSQSGPSAHHPLLLTRAARLPRRESQPHPHPRPPLVPQPGHHGGPERQQVSARWRWQILVWLLKLTRRCFCLVWLCQRLEFLSHLNGFYFFMCFAVTGLDSNKETAGVVFFFSLDFHFRSFAPQRFSWELKTMTRVSFPLQALCTSAVPVLPAGLLLLLIPSDTHLHTHQQHRVHHPSVPW